MFRAALPRTSTYRFLAAVLAVLLFVPVAVVFANDDAPGGIGGILYGLFTTIGGVFTWVGGTTLDFAIRYLVIEMGDLLRSNIGVAVDTLWTVIRDVFNILFIFGLIWIGLQTILRIGSSNLQRTLGGLIVAALLINFSLFITKAVIDFSNIAAVQIYNAGFSTQAGNQMGASISSRFMEDLELNSYVEDIIADDEASRVFNFRVAGYGFLVMILQIIAGFVFLAGGILLVYRFIALIIYMIFSPAMFVGLIFDKFMTYQRKWWSGFFSNAFVAPAYLFMLYLSAAIFTGLNSSSQAVNVGSIADAYSAQASGNGAVAIFLFFAVMAGFLIASTMVAKQMSAAGGATVMKVGGAGARLVARGGGAMTFGLAARGGRATLGQGANMISNSESAKKFAARNPRIGRAMQQGLGKVADSSFDARKTVGADKLKVGGVDLGMGAGRKGGVTSIIKEQEKADKQFNEWLGKDEKAGNSAEAELQPEVNAAEERLKSLRKEKREAVSTERQKIATLTQEARSANDDRKKEIASEVNSLKAEIDLSDREFDELITEADTNLKKVQEDQKSARVRALYQRQTQYRTILDQRAENYKNYTKYGAAAVGVGAGAATLLSGVGILGAAGVAAASGTFTAGGVRQYSDISDAQKRAVDKEYGKKTDRNGNVWVGSDKDKNDKRSKDLKALSEEINKDNGSGGSKKESDTKEGDKSESK